MIAFVNQDVRFISNFLQSVLKSFSVITVGVYSFLAKGNRQRSCLKNASDNDYRCQFHQRFTRSFYARRSPKHKKDWLLSTVFFTLLGSGGVKAVFRMFMKLSLGVNFINKLPTAFTHIGHKSIKQHCQLDYLFCAFGIYARKSYSSQYFLQFWLSKIQTNFE